MVCSDYRRPTSELHTLPILPDDVLSLSPNDAISVSPRLLNNATSAAADDQAPQEPLPDLTSSSQAPPKKIQSNCFPMDTLQHRHRGKAVLERKRGDKEKRSTQCSRLSVEPCGAMCRQRPLAHWLYRCRWLLLCIYVVVFCCVITLTVFLWNLHGSALWGFV